MGAKELQSINFACKVSLKEACKQFSTLSLLHQNKIDINSWLEQHDNVAGLFEHFDDDNNIYLILSYCSRGSLADILHNQNRTFTVAETHCYLRQILNGLNHIHGSRIIHCDMKLENVFVDASGRARIGDFGLSVRYDGHRANFNSEMQLRNPGTVVYMAPESITRGVISYKSDVWAVAVIAYIMKLGLQPFHGYIEELTFERIKNIDY